MLSNHKEVAKRKKSPGLVAESVGATVWAEFDTARHIRPVVQIEHLTSFANVGRVAYRCEAGCTCGDGVVEGLNASLGHSVFVRRSIPVSRAKKCVLRFTVLNSSAPYFKIRWIFVRST